MAGRRAARQQEGFERAKHRTRKADEAEQAAQEKLRQDHESGKPPKMSRADVERARRMDEDGDSVKPRRGLGK